MGRVTGSFNRDSVIVAVSPWPRARHATRWLRQCRQRRFHKTGCCLRPEDPRVPTQQALFTRPQIQQRRSKPVQTLGCRSSDAVIEHEELLQQGTLWRFARLFKSGQAGSFAAGYSSAMSIVRDDCGERQIRVDRMIDEFRQAQSRRRARAPTVRGDDQVVESQRDAYPRAAIATSITTAASHEND